MKIKFKHLILLLCGLSIGVFSACASSRGGGRIEKGRFPVKMLEGVSERDYAIYLPYNYDTETHRSFPVLYLLHGGYGSYIDWPSSGKLKAIADSLISNGLIQPMVIICPDGRYRNNTMWLNTGNWTPEEHFFKELMPYMESKYRIRNDKKGRAISGLSLGGGASLQYALDHPDRFIASCPMSAYVESVAKTFDPSTGWIETAVNAHNQIARINSAKEEEIVRWKTVAWMIDCGDRDFTLPSNIQLDSAMNARRLPHEFIMRRGAHDWDYWTGSLPLVLDFVNKCYQ